MPGRERRRKEEGRRVGGEEEEEASMQRGNGRAEKVMRGAKRSECVERFGPTE